MIPEQLTAIRQRANNATDGTWTPVDIWGNPGSDWEITCDDGTILGAYGAVYSQEDAIFIANARADIPQLLDHVDTLTARLAAVRELHQERPNSTSALYPNPLCSCGKEYPCPTIRVIEGDDDGSQ